MNWGTKITIAASGFILFILFMVYLTTTQSFDLVAEDYYDQELAYQEIIEKRNNTNQLSQRPELELFDNKITITMPADFANEMIEGELYLFRPSDKRMDQHIPLAFDAALQQDISTVNWPIGFYQVKLNWKDSRTSYYMEHDIYIQ